MIKKTLLSLLTLIISFTASKAQVSMKPHISVGIEYGLPVNNAHTFSEADIRVSDIYGTVIGASAKLEIPVFNPNFEITATAGVSDYLLKLGKENPYSFKPAFFIPLELGLRNYFSRIAYFEVDAGASIYNNKTAQSLSDKSTAFIYSPIIGVSAPTNKHRNTIDIGLRYESRAGQFNQFALRLAYRFGPTFPKEEKVNK